MYSSKTERALSLFLSLVFFFFFPLLSAERARRANDPNYKHFSWLFRVAFVREGHTPPFVALSVNFIVPACAPPTLPESTFRFRVRMSTCGLISSSSPFSPIRRVSFPPSSPSAQRRRIWERCWVHIYLDGIWTIKLLSATGNCIRWTQQYLWEIDFSIYLSFFNV